MCFAGFDEEFNKLDPESPEVQQLYYATSGLSPWYCYFIDEVPRVERNWPPTHELELVSPRLTDIKWVDLIHSRHHGYIEGCAWPDI